MSEKTKKTKAEPVEKALEVIILNSNKQKHNSKRRAKKNKAKAESEVPKSESSKVDEVVNYLCNAISNNESETLLNGRPVKAHQESQSITGEYPGQRCYYNTIFGGSRQVPSTSSEDFNNLFKNLQVHAEKAPVKSNNITDFLNVQLLKNNFCAPVRLEDLDWLKCKNFQEGQYLNRENIYHEFLKLSLNQNYAERSYLAQHERSSSHLVPKTEEPLHSTNDNSAKKKHFAENFSVDKFSRPEDSLVKPVQLTPNSSCKKSDETLPKGFPKKNKFQKNKNKNKNLKTNFEPSNKTEATNGNEKEKVVLNSELSQNCSESGNLKSQGNRKGKKHQTQKVSSCAVDHKFPKYLSPDELQSLSEFGVLMSGIIRINPKNYKEAYLTAPDKGMDILIEGLKDRNRALEGDEVYFVLKAKEHHRMTCDSTDLQRTAVVVGLKTINHDRGAIGTLHVIKNKSNSFVLFSPRDSKLPRLRIQRRNWPKGFLENSESFKDRLYFARISEWNDLRYADGELIKEIGVAGDLETETEAILLKHGLNVTPYGEQLKKFIPPLPFKITDSDIVNREDFRKDCVFTIDPDSAVDLDDALSCKRLRNGNYEVGVHISDVSYFLQEGTPLDSAVAKRATTVYLVQKAYHMLPFELCRLCSLTPGEDKLSFSVIWEITPDCKIVNHRFTRSIINSCAQFSYNQVQSILDNEDITYPKIFGKHSTENIKKIIFFLHKVALYLRDRRFKNGALKIDQKKIHFLLDDSRLPVDYTVDSHQPSHQLIEEFMLLANITVAEKLSCCFPDLAFLRSHPPPLPYVLKKLQTTLEKFGIILDISSSKTLQSSLLRYSGEDYESLARMLVLNNALAKPMSRAKYYCAGLVPNEEERKHYALCVPLYTHFTSPIRRYADVMVHRLLAASLQYIDLPKWTPERVQLIAENCNKKKYAAKLAEEMSVELYHNLFVGLQGTLVCDAVVCDIKDKSFDCIALSTGIHQRLYFEHIQGEVSQTKEDGIWRLTIKWPVNDDYRAETMQIVETFSIVKIELKRVNVLKIEASLLRNK